MAKKISELTELAEAPAAGDYFAIVDVSDTTMAGSGTDKKVLSSNIVASAEPAIVIPGDDTYQLDPPNAPHDCTIYYTADYADAGWFKLPALAAQPPAGTRYLIICRCSADGDTAWLQLQKASGAVITSQIGAAALTTYHIVMRLVYLGSNLWSWEAFPATGTYQGFLVENAD